MMKVRGVESLALAIGMMAAEAMGSGVGVSYYQPSTPVPSGPVASVPSDRGTTGGSAPIAGCSSCKRLGFACVDHASPAPCTPEGICKPNGPFGWSQPHWRRWPGTDDGGPSPTPLEGEDSLIPAYEEPTPEEEDKQAPPPLDDSFRDEQESEGAKPEMNRPGRELSLPPLPRPSLPAPRQDRQDRQDNDDQQRDTAPPSLPFGYAPPASSELGIGPPTPAFQRSVPTSLPKPRDESRDLPPPLPVGFTQNGVAPTLHRLPTTAGRPAPEPTHFDGAVQPVSASLPIQR
jgi:hypothetical protein